MKSLIVFLLSFTLIGLYSDKAIAFKLQSKLIENSRGELEKVASFECKPNELFCQNLCGNLVNCEITEYLCMDCVSFQNPDLRSLVTDMALLFRPTQGVVPEEQLIHFFSTQKFMLIESNLFMNVFNRQKAEEIKKTYNSFCPNKSENPMIIAKISASMDLEKFVGVICDGADQQSFAVALNSNPEYIADSKAYFDSVKQVVLSEALVLKQDLDYEKDSIKVRSKKKTGRKKVLTKKLPAKPKDKAETLNLKLSLNLD